MQTSMYVFYVRHVCKYTTSDFYDYEIILIGLRYPKDDVTEIKCVFIFLLEWSLWECEHIRAAQ